MIAGDLIIIEYNEPEITDFSARLTIGKVGHDYTGVFKDGYFDLQVYAMWILTVLWAKTGRMKRMRLPLFIH